MLNGQGPSKYWNHWQLCFVIMPACYLICMEICALIHNIVKIHPKGWQPLKKYKSRTWHSYFQWGISFKSKNIYNWKKLSLVFLLLKERLFLHPKLFTANYQFWQGNKKVIISRKTKKRHETSLKLVIWQCH